MSTSFFSSDRLFVGDKDLKYFFLQIKLKLCKIALQLLLL